ncbi:MAG: carbon-nitrogen hydrolase family protein [Hyphomonadaceae bacterium]|nr:carbon-nitrogen hydrolase family protein [Hyphomonadaceae bacterium]
MPRPLRVGVVQMRSGVEPAANRAQAMPFLREAAANGARVVATPECTTRLDRNRDRMLASIVPEKDDTEIRAWGAIAAELGVWLLLGSTTVKAEDGRGFNRSIFFAPDGKVAARYDKINLFDVQLGTTSETYRESATFAPGDKAVMATGPADAKIGFTICYDMRFPHLYRVLAKAGAEMIFVPAAFTRPTGQAHWETLLRARAIENGAYVLAPAQGGEKHEDGRGTWGHSLVIDPWGKIIAELDHDEPGLLMADLDLDLVAEARAKIPAWQGGGAFAGP